jgi:hypothetical protein
VRRLIDLEQVPRRIDTAPLELFEDTGCSVLYEIRQTTGLFFENICDRRTGALAKEGMALGHHFIENGAEGKQICPRVDGHAFQLFR